MNFHLKLKQAPSYDNNYFINPKLSYYETSKHILVCSLYINKCDLRTLVVRDGHLIRIRMCTLFLIKLEAQSGSLHK